MSDDQPILGLAYPAMQWPLVHGRTALIVIDAQNDFLHPEGWYASQGIDIEHMRRSIEPTAKLVAAARARRLPVIWTQHGFKDRSDGGIFFEMRPLLADGGLRTGTWGYAVLNGLGAEDDDWYIHKSRLSAFFGSNLEIVLSGMKIDTLLFAGVLTNQCVAATSKDAYYRDIKPIVVEQATGTTMPHLHDPAIEMIRVGWGEVRALEATLEAIEAMPLANS
ncbi:MAG: ureidoacrylate peracid hydrolase [Gammaproteobacteria bacterium]|jgi:ureidoacrylate peracid hydrolase